MVNDYQGHQNKILSVKELNNIKGFKMLSLNIRSLLPKVNMLRVDLHDVNFHALCLNETWLKPIVNDNLINLTGYNHVRADRRVRNANGDLKPGGGIMIYYQEDYVCSLIDTITTSDADLEVMGVVLSKINHPKIIIINTYRPPNGNATNALQRLSEVCDSVLSMFEHCTMYMTGDLNIDMLKQSSQSIAFAELCGQYSLYNLVNTPTRVCENTTPSLLDVCISNSPHVYSSGVVEYNLSDHLMTYCVSKMLRNDKGIDKHKIKVRSFKNYDLALLRESLVYYNWGKNYATTDVDEAWEILYSQMLANADYYAPFMNHYVRINQPEWFTAAILEASIERDR